MREKLSDYPVDHSLMVVIDTPKMAEIAQQISTLQTEYNKLRAREQRRQFTKYLELVESKVIDRLLKGVK